MRTAHSLTHHRQFNRSDVVNMSKEGECAADRNPKGAIAALNAYLRLEENELAPPLSLFDAVDTAYECTDKCCKVWAARPRILATGAPAPLPSHLVARSEDDEHSAVLIGRMRESGDLDALVAEAREVVPALRSRAPTGLAVYWNTRHAGGPFPSFACFEEWVATGPEASDEPGAPDSDAAGAV